MTQPISATLTSSSQTAKNPITEFFKGIMREAGVKLSPNDDLNMLMQEQSLVVREIEKSLELAHFDNTSEKFLQGLKVLIKKEKYFKKALLPTIFKKSRNEDSLDCNVDIEQESLFRILLKVDYLQKEIIEILLDEITSTISQEDQDACHLRLLLRQLRYLPHIRDPGNLTTKLLDIIDIASYPFQLEILDSIPDILPDSEYNATAKNLAKMLHKNDNLSGPIIDCLNAFSLNCEIRTQIQDHILSKMLSGTSIRMFPVYLDFLMTDCNPKSVPANLMKIRNALNVTITSDEIIDKENESSKILIFNRLQKAATSKLVSEGWLTVISNFKNHTDHKPIDLTLLFMLHSSSKLKKRSIEATFRKRIKDGQFKCTLVEQLFGKYLPQQLMCDYFTTIVEIGSSLLRGSTDPVITEFATTLLKLLFSHEYIDPTFRQEILENIILLVVANDQKNVSSILHILVDLAEEIVKSPNHAVILMRLLEKLDTFELHDVKLVFEILCSLTCSDESLLGLKEELHMMVRKFLSSSKRTFKRRGIISAVVMAKHMAFNKENVSELMMSEESVITINQLQGSAKEAATILELTNMATSGCSELVALYYDQLGSMLIKSDHLDRNFLFWLEETITNEFQNIFVTENVCENIDDLQFSMQYNLNTKEEMDPPIGVNIAQLTLKPKKTSVVVLAPHFRLLRILHYKQQNGDLTNIDALLGCAVILPKPELRDNLGIQQQTQNADCIFHCINWFRETISGFVKQNNDKLRRKVIQRLDNLHELEKLLMECLGNIPGYKLPLSYFNPLSQVTNDPSSPVNESKKALKHPRKKLKTKTFVADISASVTTTSKITKNIKKEININFREIDTDLVILLKYPLHLEEAVANDELCLNLNHLNFILKDFVTKLALLTNGQNLGLLHLNIVAPSQLMEDCKNILPNINKHFQLIIDQIREQGNNSSDNNELRISFGLILECLSLIFRWSGFQHSKQLDLLRDILKAFRSQDTSTPLKSVNHLSTELINRLANYTDYCSEFIHALLLIKTMEALHVLTPSSSIRSKIAKTAGNLLKKEWEKQNSANIDVLIKSYLSSANVKTLCGMVATLQEQAPNLRTKGDTLEMLKSINKSNFYILYRNLWTSLHDRVKAEIRCLTNAQHLALWRTISLTMQGLMTVAKAQETKNNLVCFLKKSITILKIFLSQGIPILEIELKFQSDKVLEILKTIQCNTRFLHHLCCYSKLMKDASLMNHVPQFRLTLESLVYRVKAALVANACSEAFWMGNLKNRDLEGEDILTQSTECTTKGGDNEDEGTSLDGDNEDEEMALDEESSSDDVGSGNKSGSEIFE